LWVIPTEEQKVWDPGGLKQREIRNPTKLEVWGQQEPSKGPPKPNPNPSPKKLKRGEIKGRGSGLIHKKRCLNSGKDNNFDEQTKGLRTKKLVTKTPLKKPYRDVLEKGTNIHNPPRTQPWVLGFGCVL